MSRGTRVRWLAAYAAATFLAFPHPVAGRVLDLGWLFAWIAPGCLILGLAGCAPRRAARLGFVAGLAAHSAVLHWIYVVTVTYGHAPPPVGVIAPVGLAGYIAVFPAAFGAAAAWLARRGGASPWALAAVWTALDHLRSFFLTGFPWATLGYAQHQNPLLMELAPITGVYGLSFAAALGGAAWARGVGGAGWDRAARGALAGVLALHLLGAAARVLAPGPGDGPALRVAVVQGNIDQGVKWDPAWARRTLEIYEDLTRRAAAQGARWVVWPETAVPGSVNTDPVLRERLAELAREVGAVLVVGGVGIEPDASGGPSRYYDSAFVFDAQGAAVDRYDKAHLVPFGEYVPLRGLIGRFASAVARGIAPTDVSAGARPRALLLPDGAGGGVPAGVPICYELLFPDLMRRFVDDGAGVLLAITNDAWYGRTGAPHQFLVMTAMRSAENRVWTARAANTGVSAFIDERGRVKEQTDIFERGFLVRDVPLRAPPVGGTFYTRHGDVFAWGCWLAALAWAGVLHRRPADPSTVGAMAGGTKDE